MRFIHFLFSSGIVFAAASCSSSDEVIADPTEPVTRGEVLEACEDYCIRVSACDEAIDQTVCRETCPAIADRAVAEQCAAPVHAALDCIDRYFCQHGYPSTTDPANTTPCSKKAAAVPCVLVTPAELDPAFAFFGTGLGMSAFGGEGYGSDGSRSCRAGTGYSSYLDGGFEIDCAAAGDGYSCSCAIDDRVVSTFQTDERVCPIGHESALRGFYQSCGWRY